MAHSSHHAPAEIVVDANILLNVVLAAHPFHTPALALFGDCAVSGTQLTAPAWWQAEADSSLRRMIAAGVLTSQAGEIAQARLDAAPVDILYYPNSRTLARSIADAIGAPRVYDATYAALARLRDCPFWTADERFYNAVQNALAAARKRRQSPPFPDVYFVAHYSGEYARR